MKTEGKEGENKGRKREKERERLRGTELEKTLRRIKGSEEVGRYESIKGGVYFFTITLCSSLFFYYYFVLYLSRKWFVTIILISECLIFVKLNFNVFWSSF